MNEIESHNIEMSKLATKQDIADFASDIKFAVAVTATAQVIALSCVLYILL